MNDAPEAHLYVIAIKSVTPPILNDVTKQALLLEAINEYAALTTERDDVRVVQLFYLMQQANKLPDGDYIEMGVHHGLTLRIIHKCMVPECMLYGLDTFEGFNQQDLDIEYTRAAYRMNGGDPNKVGGFWPTSPEQVEAYLGKPSNLKLVKGWFPDAYAGLEDRKWRFVHLDMDLYQPTLRALQMLWSQVVPGGMVVVHDYGAVAFAARQAVDEFCESQCLYPVELVDSMRSIVLRKQG
jgi:O-methyltransferase